MRDARSFVLLRLHFSQPAVDVRDLIDPPPPLCVLELENVVERPVKVVREIGYLLVQAFRGVAYDPPNSTKSTSCFDWQSGQVTTSVVFPSSLMRRYSACR